MIFRYVIYTYIPPFPIVQLDPLMNQIPFISESQNEHLPSPVDGEPIWESEESTFDFSSPVASSTPTLSFINGKHEVSIEPEKSYSEKEARGDVFESVSSTLQNQTQTEEKVETSNFDSSLVETGATQDGSLKSTKDVTYPMPIFLSTVEPNYDKEQIIAQSTSPSSLVPDPEVETLMREGTLITNSPSGITIERTFSPKPHQPSAVPTNATATTIEPFKPINTIEESYLPFEDGSGQETAIIQEVQVTQKSTTLQATESDKLDHTMVATSDKKPLLPFLTDTTDIAYSTSNYLATELRIKEYAFTTEIPMSATHETDNMSSLDTMEKQAISKSTNVVTSSPGIEGITSTKSLFMAEEEGSGGEIHDFIFTKTTLQNTVTNDFDAMTPHRQPIPDTALLHTEETLLAKPSVNLLDSSENIFSTREEENLDELSAISTVSTVEKTSKDVPSVTHSESFSFSEADGSGDQLHVMSTTEFSKVFPLHTTTHSEQNITTTSVYTVQRVDETVTVKTVSEETEANQATVSPSPFSSSYIAMETTVEQVQISDISEKVIQEPFTDTIQRVMSEEGSGDQSPDNPAVEPIATTVPSKSSEVPITVASEIVFSTENSEKKTTNKLSVESISQGLPSTKSESLLLFPDIEGSGNQITNTFTINPTSLYKMSTSHASTQIPAFSVSDGTTIKVETNGVETEKPSPTITSDDVTSILLHSAPEDDFSGQSILDKLGTTSFMQVHSTVTDDQNIRTRTTQSVAKENVSTTITKTVDLTESISKESRLINIGTTPDTAEFNQKATDTVVETSHYKTESPFNTRYVGTSGVQMSNIVSKELHFTSVPTKEIPQSEGSGEESGEYEDGVSGDFSNTVFESIPPSQAPSTKHELTTKSEAVIGTELPAHPTVLEVSSDFTHSTVTGTILAFTVGDDSQDQNEDSLNIVSITSPTSVPFDVRESFTTTSSLTVTADHSSLSTTHLESIHNTTNLISTATDMENIGASSIDQESSILEGSADNISETTEASKEYSVRTDEAEISYTKSTLEYSDVEMATLSTMLTSESTSQKELMSSSLESGSGDTEDTTIETEGADYDGSGDLVSTVLETSPPSVTPRMEHVTMTSLPEIKYKGTVDNQVLNHVEGSEMPTEVNTEFSVNTEEAETTDNKTKLDHLIVETSTQYTLSKSESTSTTPSTIQKETITVPSDTGSGGMEDTTFEGTEDESTEDRSGTLIESAAPSQAPSAGITTENTIHTGIQDLPLAVPTSAFTHLVALTNEDSLGKQSTVTTVPVMMTGTDSIYLTSKHVDTEPVVSTTDVDKGTLKLFTEDGGSGDEMLVTTTSELQKSAGVTLEATTQIATSTEGTAKVQLSHSVTKFTEIKNTEDNSEISTQGSINTSLPTASSYTTIVDEARIQTTPKSVVTATDVTTPVLSVIYQGSTDKEVTTVVPSSSEIRSSKITTRLHDSKSITIPVIIFTEDIKDEDELFSTVTDSMRDHSTKPEIITKDDMIIDADTVSVLDPSSPFASTIITEEAAGITAVTITPQSSGILTEEPEGSGTDNPVYPSTDLHLPTQSPLEWTTAKHIDLSTSVKSEETKLTLSVDILDERFTAQTVPYSKITPHLSMSTHSAQTSLYSTHRPTDYNTGKSHPSQTTSYITHSTNQPAFTTTDSVYTTRRHSHIISKPSHTTTSQPKAISHVTSTTSHSEFRITQTMPKTSVLIDIFSGDSVSVEDSGVQTSIPGVIISTNTSLPSTFTAEVNSTLHGIVSAISGYNADKTTDSKQSVFILDSQKSGTEEGSGFISELTLSSGSDITETTPAHKTAVASGDMAQVIEHGEPSTLPYTDDTSVRTTTKSDSRVQPTTKYEVTEIVQTESVDVKHKSTTETVEISSKMPLFDSTRGPFLSEESSGDMLSEIFTEESTAVSDHRDFSTTHSDALVSLSEETDSTTYASTVLTTSRFHPEAVFEMTLTAQPTKGTLAAKDLSTATATPMVSTIRTTSENVKYTQYTQITKQSEQLTQEIPIMESNTDIPLDADATAEPSFVESIPDFTDSEIFSKPESETLLESTPVFESKTSVSSTEWSSISDKPLRLSTVSPMEHFSETTKKEVTTVLPSSDETSPALPILKYYDSVTRSVDEETAAAVLESTDYTTSSADGIQIHSDTTASPKDFSDDTILIKGSDPNPGALYETQRPTLDINLGYTVIEETYDIAGMTL